MILLESSILKGLMSETLREQGACEDACYHMPESLVQTSLRGVDSHGINLFPHYMRALKSGRINRQPDIKIIKEAESTAQLDADSAYGHHAGSVAVKIALEKALRTGIGAVNVKNSSHFGAAAYFALQASEKDFIGLSFTNADSLVKAFGSTEKFFGTNPICFSAPMQDESPFCLDMATSLVAWNKIENHKRLNKPLPLGWGFDEKGETVENPHLAKSLSPIGLYKGYGLAMVVEIICAILAEGPVAKELKTMYWHPIEERRYLSHFFCVIDINKFLPVEAFKKRLQSMADEIRALPADKHSEKVMIPGDPEKEKFKERILSGIPVDEIKFEEFIQISENFKKVVI